jgi:hypothetical protein
MVAGRHGDSSMSGATFYPIFITKSRNCQKFNSHLQFFSLCNLLKPQCVFLTDCGTLYNTNCLSKLVEFLCEHRNEVAGCTARQRVMDRKSIREVQQNPFWISNGVNMQSTSSAIVDSLKWWLSPAPLQVL